MSASFLANFSRKRLLRFFPFLKKQGFAKMADVMQTLKKSKPLVAVCQMTSTANKEDNFLVCKTLIEKAKIRGAEVVFFPEAFDYIGESKEQAIAMAETMDGDLISRYQSLAKNTDIWLSLGGCHQKTVGDPNRISNTHIIIDSSGKIQGSYVKVHMFDLEIKDKVRLHESDYTAPGKQISPPVQMPIGRVGLSICYDLRFPEISTALVQQGAQILTYPSAFTQTTGMAHWEVLLRCRAIENQCYVIAAAQTGRHNAKRSSYGRAMVIDPWGAVVAECHEGTDLCLAEIDLDYLENIRSQMPVWEHRRPDLYGYVHSLSSGTGCEISPQDNYHFGPHQLRGEVFYRTPLCYAFVNIKPVVPGHVLVSSIRKVPRFTDLTQAEVADMWFTAQKVARVVEKHFGGTSVTFGVQDGLQAGQTVPHVHIHILPRKAGDFTQNDDIYRELQAHDKEESELRTQDVMEKEAQELRSYFI